MNVEGYYEPGELAHSSPDRTFAWTWPPVPTSRKGFKLQAMGGHSGFIPKGAKHPREAFQVIEFLYGDEASQTIFDNTGWLGARKPFIAKVEASKYKGLDFYLNSYTQSDKLYGTVPNPIIAFTATAWNTALQNVLYGKAQPKDALAQLQRQVTQEYKQRFPNC
jgi:ABC-type glycerol-3-phosphate transport system substrate-binding protein